MTEKYPVCIIYAPDHAAKSEPPIIIITVSDVTSMFQGQKSDSETGRETN